MRRENLARRQLVLRATRAFFEGEGFDEVETPALQVSPGLEPHLMAFQTVLRDPGERLTRRLYLHTSPEFAMKKLLAAGMTKIWQLARCYRNAERSATHHPEFAMLEWYRADADYTALMDDCEGLLRAAARAVGIERFERGTNVSNPFGPFERLTVAEAFARYCGLDLLAASPDPTREGDELAALDRLAAAATAGTISSSGCSSSMSKAASAWCARRSSTTGPSRWPPSRAPSPAIPAWPSASSFTCAVWNSPTRSAN
jgi:lysyl-tRNA synthetase class 2